MATLVNAQTNEDVQKFLEAVENAARREDALTLLPIMKKITGKQPKMWGKNIVGFGCYKYQRKNGQEFEWFNVGFSPGKANLTVYVMYDINTVPKLLKELGPHKTGKGCLYLKRLDTINMDALKKIIAKSDKWER